MKNVTEETKFLADQLKSYQVLKNNAMVIAYTTTLQEATDLKTALEEKEFKLYKQLDSI